MSANNNTPILPFYHSVKFWWVILFSVSLIVLFVFSVAFLAKHYNSANLWEINATLFAFLGVMLTAGAAIPAISAIFSYIGFAENHKKAEKQLYEIAENLKQYKQEFEKLPKIQQFIKDKENEKQFLNYFRNQNNIELTQWVSQAIQQKQENYYLQLLSDTAKTIYYENEDFKNYQSTTVMPILEYRMDLVEHYRLLATIDGLFIERYLSHLNTMLDLFHQEFLSKKDDEEASFYESFIYRWVLDLISFDEQPSNKVDISTHAVTHTILDLYEHSLLNSAHFKKEVQDRIIYSSCQKEKVSQKLGIKKPIFKHANVIGTPQ